MRLSFPIPTILLVVQTRLSEAEFVLVMVATTPDISKESFVVNPKRPPSLFFIFVFKSGEWNCEVSHSSSARWGLKSRELLICLAVQTKNYLEKPAQKTPPLSWRGCGDSHSSDTRRRVEKASHTNSGCEKGRRILIGPW